MSVVELYEGSIKALSAAERLRLATMILNDIPPEGMVDFSTEWSDEDMKELTRHPRQQFAKSSGELKPILTSLSPEDQIEALNALTSKTRGLPVLPDEAFDRDRLQERTP